MEVVTSAKLKWGGGKIDINAKITAQGDQVPPVRPGKTKSDVVPKEPNVQELKTTIETPAQPDVVVTTPLACDQSEASKQSATAEGNLSFTGKATLKSKFIVTP